MYFLSAFLLRSRELLPNLPNILPAGIRAALIVNTLTGNHKTQCPVHVNAETRAGQTHLLPYLTSKNKPIL